MVDFTNIMHESKQFPLHIDFGFGAEGEVIQSFLNAEVGKDRLYDRQPAGIDLPAFRRVDPGLHVIDQVGVGALDLDRQEPPRGGGLAQTSGSHGTGHTVLFAGTINIINAIAVALAAGTAFQDISLRTDIHLSGGIETKIRSGERGGGFAVFETRLFLEAWIALAEMDVGDISVQSFLLA